MSTVKLVQLKDENKNPIAPKTSSEAVIMTDGATLQNWLGTSVPSDAVFTDTTYEVATTTTAGLMSAQDKQNLDQLGTCVFNNVTVVSSNIGVYGKQYTVFNGNHYYIHLCFTATANIPANTQLFKTEHPLQIAIANAAWFDVTGTTVIPFYFSTDGSITCLYAISSGTIFCIDTVVT